MREHPTLFHMAGDGTWPSIREHGLLSTRALLDLFDPPVQLRDSVLKGVRRTSVDLEREDLGRVTVRDQRPLKFLRSCLSGGTTEQEFLDLLNGRVFFWLSLRRLQTLLSARLYKDAPQTVLHFDTAEVLDRYGDRVHLAPYNTGSVQYRNSPQRGRDVFRSVEDFPFDDWRIRRGRTRDAVVELTVLNAVPDAHALATRVERWSDGHPVETLYVRQD